MKKIFIPLLISFFIFPIAALAIDRTVCLNGGGTPDSGLCSCPNHSWWNGATCQCDDYYTGSKGVCTPSGQTSGSDCSSIICVPECDWAGTGTCSTVKKTAFYSASAGKCVCPTGYYSNEAPTQGSTSGTGSGTGTGTDTGTGTGTTTTGTTTITGPTTASTGVISNPITATSFTELVDAVIEWILNIAMVLAPLVLVYGGLTYITAAGDTSKMTQAKKIILYAVIGFILALLAKSLVDIFKEFGS
jgi:hypothetical protein